MARQRIYASNADPRAGLWGSAAQRWAPRSPRRPRRATGALHPGALARLGAPNVLRVPPGHPAAAQRGRAGRPTGPAKAPLWLRRKLGGDE